MASDKVVQEYADFRTTFEALTEIYREMSKVVAFKKSDSEFELNVSRRTNELDRDSVRLQ